MSKEERLNRVWNAIRAGHQESGDIAKAAGIPRPSINNYLRELWKSGVIERQTVTEEQPRTFRRYSAPMDP